MRGLWNLGNTCFFNTAVQCLAHTPPLTKHFFSLNYEGDCDVTREYQNVVKQLFIKGKTDPVNPRDLFGAFRTRFPEFADGSQHDAQEVILHLIDVFEHSLGKEFITDLFNGTELQETSWSEGTSIIRTPFTTLLLDVTEPTNLHDLLQKRMNPISVQNYIDSGGKTHESATINNRIEKWPKFISFSFSMYDHKFPIEIPLEFEGRKLFACVLHRGHKNNGHYALLVRRFNQWYVKDDESVTIVPEFKTLRGEFYLAFYRPS